MTTAVIFAGGIGVRMGSSEPKQFLTLAGKPVLAHTLELFQAHPSVDRIRVVTIRDYFARVSEICKEYGIDKLAGISEGGETAQDSIYSGLCAALKGGDGEDAVVLLHDGVRPYVTSDVITKNIESVKRYGNAVTFTPCYETILLSKDGKKVDAMPRRSESFTAQAPQSFILKDIYAAHNRIRSTPERYNDLVDQAMICWKLGIAVHLVEGNRGNIKITTTEDILMLEALLENKGERI